MQDNTIFGKEVKKQLIDLDMTQKELAIRVGAHESYIRDVLGGRRAGNKYKHKIIKELHLESNSKIQAKTC